MYISKDVLVDMVSFLCPPDRHAPFTDLFFSEKNSLLPMMDSKLRFLFLRVKIDTFVFC